MSTFNHFGANWKKKDLAWINACCIRAGGRWMNKNTGKMAGEGLFYHYRELQSLLWPDEVHTRWTDLCLREILENGKKENGKIMTGIIGPGSSWKTHTCAKYALTDYLCFPSNTGIVISSTDMKGLERRVWGDIKKLHREARERHDWIAGHVVDYMHIISSDDIKEGETRDIRNGIICVPCLSSSGGFQGLGRYVGFKNDRVRFIADESQFMPPTFLEAQSNYIHNPDYKFIPIGNPNLTNPENSLTLVAEPFDGWDSVPDDGKTKVWDAKFMNGRFINLVGTDSPNYDYPEDQPPKFPKLVNRETLKIIIQTYGKESEQYYSQGIGIIKSGIAGNKIITRTICNIYNTSQKAVWMGEPLTRIGMLDAAYGGVGGDRCVLRWLDFGLCDDKHVRISFGPVILVPVKVDKNKPPEDQIAEFCKKEMEGAGVDPKNFFFDGRGSLAISLSRVWSPEVNSLEFGGTATKRAVKDDIFIDDPGGFRRPKLADEHYSKFVSELWYSFRYAIESDQIRGLDAETIMDGSPREFMNVKGDRIEVESKRDMKKRTGKSPDLMDAVVIGLEGARRRGFTIKRPEVIDNKPKNNDKQWEEDANSFDKLLTTKLLQHV